MNDNGNTALLRLRALAKSYRLGANTVPVLRDLSLEIGAGEMVVIMGPGGSGKTTLLNCISGNDLCDAGTIELQGRTVDYRSEEEHTRLRRHQIGMVFQAPIHEKLMGAASSICWPRI